MGRPRKPSREPYWRSARGRWYVHHKGRQVNLGPDKDVAYRRWHEMLARPEDEPAPAAGGQGVFVAEVLDRFLGWCEVNRAKATYQWHRHFCQRLIAEVPVGLTVAQLRPYHLTRVMDASGWGENSKHDFVSAVLRALNWAVKQGIIDRNPVAGTERPARQARELTATDADVTAAIGAVTAPQIKTLIRFVWLSGVRPQEVRVIEARHLDRANSRLVIPPNQAKGKKAHRVVYLTPEALAVLEPLVKDHPAGPVFRNTRGNPWTKDAIKDVFRRVETKTGLKLHLGALRKGYATEGLKGGVDTITMAHLLGHASPVMLSKVYARVQQDPKHMAAAARKVKPGSGDA